MTLCIDQAQAAVTAGSAAPMAPAATPSDVPFDLYELRVIGNSKLNEVEVDKVLYPFLGAQRSFKDVEAARAALEALYHEHGYGTVFVDIPEQNVDGAVVRLRVSENPLGRVSIAGTRYFSNRQIRAALPEARSGVTPALPALQSQLAALNTQTRDRQVTPILKAGSEPGTVDLNLRVEDQLPLHASLELNNEYTVDTEPLRLVASLSYDNLFGRLDSLGVQYQTAPQNRDQVDVWAASYGTRLFDDRARLTIFYYDSKSAVATLGGGSSTLNVLGNGSGVGTRLSIPLPTSPDSAQVATLGADYKKTTETIGPTGGSSGTASSSLSTPISYVNLSAAYSGGWRQPRLQPTFSVTVNFGLRGWQNSPAEFENKRYLAQPNYIYLRSSGTIDWPLATFLKLHLGFSGQYSVDPLISNEQFSIGGFDGVRGYLEAEGLGDRGIKGVAQLGPRPWAPWGGRVSFTTFLYYDYGYASLVDALPGEAVSYNFGSAGMGLDVAAWGHFTGSVLWANPLRDGPQTRSGDSRVLFTARSAW